MTTYNEKLTTLPIDMRVRGSEHRAYILSHPAMSIHDIAAARNISERTAAHWRLILIREGADLPPVTPVSHPLTPARVWEMHESGMTNKEIARELHVSVTRISTVLREEAARRGVTPPRPVPPCVKKQEGAYGPAGAVAEALIRHVGWLTGERRGRP